MEAREKESARWVWPVGYAVCAAGFALAVVAFYPGYMSPDSMSQLAQGRAWEFTDWHPPLMAALWGLLDRVFPGPAGMLVLHNAAYWGAAALFWRATYRRSAWLGLGLAGFGFMPQVLSNLSTVWKDVGMGVSLLLASALLYRSRQTGSKGALLASVPLARRPRLLPAALGVAYFLALTGAVTLTTEALVRGNHAYAGQTVLLHDLAAVSVARGEPLFPEYIVADEHFSMEKVAQRYAPYISTAIVGFENSGLRLSGDPRDMEALRAKWLEVVARNPGAYLRHRWAAFEWAAGLNRPEVCFPYLIASYGRFDYKTNDLAVHRLLKAYFWAARNTLLFRGFFWLLVALALLYFSLRGRLRGDLELVFVLALSGLLYGAAYFFIAPSCDFRFFWWTMLAATAGLLFFTSFAAGRLRESYRARRAASAVARPRGAA
jgi:hypothetical protein